MITSIGGSTRSSNCASRTDRRYGSAAAIVTLSPAKVVSTPVSTGRLSSVAATNATSLTMRRSVACDIRVVGFSGICGMIGNSSASIPLMFASYGPDRRCTVFVRTFSESSTLPGGSELTKSMNSLAGTVIAPSSSTFAGTQQLMPTSRLVAVRRRRPESVRSRTLPRMGRLPLVETPLPAIPSPCARFSCKQMTFTRPSPLVPSRDSYNQ